MTTAGTRAVVSTDNALKKPRWVWRPKGNYMDHESKESGSFMLKKFEYAEPKGIYKSVIFLQDHAVVDSGCSSHMTGNKTYLSDYEDYNGGFVAFGSDPKGENSVLFIDTECLILSPSFKLLDESQVVLRATVNVDAGIRKMLLKRRTTLLTEADQALKVDLEKMMPYVSASNSHWTDFNNMDNTIDVQSYSHSQKFIRNYTKGLSGKDKEPTQEYILLPLHPHKRRISVEDVDSKDVAEKEEQHTLTEAEQALKDDLERMVAQEMAAKALDDDTSTSTCANAGGSSFVYLGGQIPIDASTLPNADLPIDPNIPDLEDDSDLIPNDGILSEAYDDEDVGVEADFNNMDNTIDVSPIPTLRVHKDHPKGQILGDPKLAVQTRGKIQKASSVQQALKVWILVDLPSGKKVIGTKWVFRNKRDKRSIVVKNKARLVAQWFRQEEGIDYDEVFAPVARIEAIRLFLAFASFMGFSVYQMDVKSAFLYGTIGEELGQDVADILKKFDFCSIRIATNPIESNKPLVKDEDGVDVDVHVYRSMIGSLMYLTASRPDIMFAVCAYARFQVTPKASHLNAVKRNLGTSNINPN
ncbi:ribonuclease H-like domain-containing protein [Tanacetum coccineum]